MGFARWQNKYEKGINKKVSNDIRLIKQTKISAYFLSLRLIKQTK